LSGSLNSAVSVSVGQDEMNRARITAGDAGDFSGTGHPLLWIKASHDDIYPQLRDEKAFV